MGSFSWLFADTNNTKNLRADRRGYVACPDGTFICEPCYETYGIFDGKDIYDLVVDWNRKFIAENPDHLLPHVHCWTKDGALVRTTYRLKGAKKGCTVSVSEGTWLHFGSVGITLHKVGELNLTRTKHVNRWQEKTIKQINEELHNSPWRP